jgi:hypothetical protein
VKVHVLFSFLSYELQITGQFLTYISVLETERLFKIVTPRAESKYHY